MPQGRHLFVSDLHLDSAAPRAVATFLHFLSTDARRCDGLYILGDLFETWIGDDDDDAVQAQVCDALRALTGAGIPCHVQHGNRDFLLGAGFAARTGCTLLPDPFLFEGPAGRVVVSHGDALCTRDVAYQRFRRVVRRRGVQRTWLMLPLALRRALATGLRGRSRAHTRAMAADAMDVTEEAVQALFRSTGADLLIHGHTHRPGVHLHTVDGRRRTRIVLGDWYEQGSLLELHADGHHALHVISWTEPSTSRQGVDA